MKITMSAPSHAKGRPFMHLANRLGMCELCHPTPVLNLEPLESSKAFKFGHVERA